MDRGFSMMLEKSVYNFVRGFLLSQNKKLIEDIKFANGGIF